MALINESSNNKNPAGSTRESAGFDLEGAVAHATRGRDGRQEGRERGYYNLHPNLNKTLLHNFQLSIVHYQVRSISLCPVLRHHHLRHR